MPTVKELSATLGVSGQSIRNYAKTELGIVGKQGKQLVFSFEQASIISNHFGSQIKEDNENNLLELQHENQLLKQKVEILEDTLNILKEQLKATNEALEREQNISRGFWSRLGQKLLDKGK